MASMKHKMTEKERQEYALALRVGNRRFGTKCNHEKTRNGVCTNCLRKIIV